MPQNICWMLLIDMNLSIGYSVYHNFLFEIQIQHFVMYCVPKLFKWYQYFMHPKRREYRKQFPCTPKIPSPCGTGNQNSHKLRCSWVTYSSAMWYSYVICVLLYMSTVYAGRQTWGMAIFNISLLSFCLSPNIKNRSEFVSYYYGILL